ncbi:MAG: hypothetical protein ACE15C_10740 [Phycisphaerae bacterium]
MRPGARDTAAAFTLMEMVLSLGIATILLMGIVGAMFIAQNGMASSAARADCFWQESRATQMIALDAGLATAFTERTSTAVTMIVPPRNGDTQPETIRYAWSGVPGDPLTRQYNGEPPATIASNVHQFNLTYLLRTLDP